MVLEAALYVPLCVAYSMLRKENLAGGTGEETDGNEPGSDDEQDTTSPPFD